MSVAGGISLWDRGTDRPLLFLITFIKYGFYVNLSYIYFPHPSLNLISPGLDIDEKGREECH